MNEIHIPEHFIIQELVPPDVYKDRGVKAWELLDPRLLITLDALREKYGSITINNWHRGHKRMWSGLRTEDSPYGSQYSQHRFGRAADCLLPKVSVSEVREHILANPNEFPFINSVELDTSWLHFDVRNCDRIKTYTP